MAHDMVDDWVGADFGSDSGKPSKDEARVWFQDTLRKRGNTYHFTGEEKGQLNNYINEFGNTFFWADSSAKQPLSSASSATSNDNSSAYLSMSAMGQVKLSMEARSQAEDFFRVPSGHLKSVLFDGSEEDKQRFIDRLQFYSTFEDRSQSDYWYNMLIKNVQERLDIYSSGKPWQDRIGTDLFGSGDGAIIGEDSDLHCALQYIEDNNIPHDFERVYEALINAGMFEDEDTAFDVAFLVCDALGVPIASSGKIPIQQDLKGLIAMVRNWLQRVHEGLMERSVFYQNLMRLLKGNGYSGSRANNIYEELMAGKPVEVVMASFKRIRSSLDPLKAKVFDNWIREYDLGWGDRDPVTWFQQNRRQIERDLVAEGLDPNADLDNIVDEISHYYFASSSVKRERSSAQPILSAKTKNQVKMIQEHMLDCIEGFTQPTV